MSTLFGSLNTAVSGLTAQAAAFGNISDNVANSQTVGFKGVDTTFQDFLTTSTSAENLPGAVEAKPLYTNDVQGTVTSSTDPLALAISGQGFFAASEANGESTSATPTFSPQQYYTRAGDFTLTKDGYLVNSDGAYLKGWPVVAGTANQSSLVPIQVAQGPLMPLATSTISVAANLPATPASTDTIVTQAQAYDSTGTAHTIDLSWQNLGGNKWRCGISSPDIVNYQNIQGGETGNFYVTFAADGTIANLQAGIAGGNLTAPPPAPYSITSGEASATFDANFDDGTSTQPITLNIGTIGGTDGVTQFAGTTYDQRSVTQDGYAAGAFNGATTDANGNIIANYDNGQQRTIAQVPVITFAAADALQRVNGQAFTATEASGVANAQFANTNSAGQLVTQSVENSNVDIASEFSKLIIAQQAYGANTKVVTSVNQLLQETIDMQQ